MHQLDMSNYPAFASCRIVTILALVRLHVEMNGNVADHGGAVHSAVPAALVYARRVISFLDRVLVQELRIQWQPGILENARTDLSKFIFQHFSVQLKG